MGRLIDHLFHQLLLRSYCFELRILLYFLPCRANNQLPINIPSFSAVCHGPRMNVLEPFSFPFIRDVVSKCTGANQMVLVPRLTINR